MTDKQTPTKTHSHKAPSRQQMARRVLMNAYIVIVGAYGLNVSLLLIARAIVGERWNIIGLMNSYLHLLILPAVILLPISLILRRRWLVIELAAPFFFFISIYGGQFLPRSLAAPAEAPRLRVLSFNINKDNQHTTDVIEIIKTTDADVVAIQELSPWMASSFDDQLAALYPYRAFHPQTDFSGQGMLSRFPLSDDTFWQINLGHQSTQIDLNGQPISFYNVHPVHPLRGLHFDGISRAEEVDEILSRTTSINDPLLIAGDFNMTNLSDDYARVANRYGDTYQQVGWGMGFGFPNFANAFNIKYLPPIARIDYIFHDEHFQPLEMQVLPTSGGSDHYPVVATFALIDTP